MALRELRGTSINQVRAGDNPTDGLSLDGILCNPALAKDILGLQSNTPAYEWLRLMTTAYRNLQNTEEMGLQSTDEAHEQRLAALIETEPEDLDVQVASMARAERLRSKRIPKYGASPEQLGKLGIAQQIHQAAEKIMQDPNEQNEQKSANPAYMGDLYEVVIYSALLTANEGNTNLWNSLVAAGTAEETADSRANFQEAYNKIHPTVVAAAKAYFQGEDPLATTAVVEGGRRSDVTDMSGETPAAPASESSNAMDVSEQYGEGMPLTEGHRRSAFKPDWQEVLQYQLRAIVDMAAEGFFAPSSPMTALLEKVDFDQREKVSGRAFYGLLGADLIGTLVAFGTLNMDPKVETAVVITPAIVLMWLMINLGKAAYDAGVRPQSQDH